MHLSKTLTILAVLLSSLGFSQDLEYKKLQWDSTVVKVDTLENKEFDYSAVYLKRENILEYAFVKGELWGFTTTHQKVVVYDDRGIDNFNKEYLPVSEAIEIIDVKARTITMSGKVVEFDKSNMKKVDNLDNKGSYNLFAIDGVERGSVVELMYTMKVPFNVAGNRMIQKGFPIDNGKFSLLCPDNLVFDTKVSNYDKQVKDTIIGDKRIYTLEYKDMVPMRDEKYATPDANKAKVEYVFTHNLANTQTPFYTWEWAAKHYHGLFFDADKKDKKMVSKILKGLNIANMSEVDKIKTIENHIKEEYKIREIRGYRLSSKIEDIINTKSTPEDGLVKMHIAFYEAAGIDFQFGISCDRFDTKFNEDFFTWEYLTDYFIYFPSINKFSSPADNMHRLGIIPYGLAGNKGMFLKVIKLGDFASAMHEIKDIPHNSMEENVTKQIIDIDFSDDLLTANINYKYELGGYEAYFVKPYYELLPEENQEEMVEQYLKIMGDDTEIVEQSAINTDRKVSCLDENIIFEGKIEVKSLLESAGKNIIFNVGDVIGPQVEMYDEHKRVNPVEIRYLHYYDRIIEVKIPEGYTVKNLESLDINHEFTEDGEKLMGFKTEYKIENGKVIITCVEYYNKLKLDLDKYEDFRTVINAAADFNKASLIFERN